MEDQAATLNDCTQSGLDGDAEYIPHDQLAARTLRSLDTLHFCNGCHQRLFDEYMGTGLHCATAYLAWVAVCVLTETMSGLSAARASSKLGSMGYWVSRSNSSGFDLRLTRPTIRKPGFRCQRNAWLCPN